MVQQSNNETAKDALVEAATTGIAAASNAPFLTAFKITIGIALARLSVFVLAMLMIIGFFVTIVNLLK